VVIYSLPHEGGALVCARRADRDNIPRGVAVVILDSSAAREREIKERGALLHWADNCWRHWHLFLLKVQDVVPGSRKITVELLSKKTVFAPVRLLP
jgi:hypothetical protein